MSYNPRRKKLSRALSFLAALLLIVIFGLAIFAAFTIASAQTPIVDPVAEPIEVEALSFGDPMLLPQSVETRQGTGNPIPLPSGNVQPFSVSGFVPNSDLNASCATIVTKTSGIRQSGFIYCFIGSGRFAGQPYASGRLDYLPDPRGFLSLIPQPVDGKLWLLAEVSIAGGDVNKTALVWVETNIPLALEPFEDTRLTPLLK